jgi:hypothetical protein
MESPMLNMLKLKNPDKEYPSNLGKHWSVEEETMLLDLLDKGVTVEKIAILHNRTIGGINVRLKTIAYIMFINGKTMEEIMDKPKMNEQQIKEIITIK